MTLDCVQSIFSNTPQYEFEVIVVDNGSQDRSVELLEAKLDSRVTLVPLRINRFFGEGNNIGAEYANGEVLLFLNNDVLVEEGWLQPLLEQLERPEVGAVGPMFVYPDGRIQEVGAYVDQLGNPVQAGKMLTQPDLRFEVPREVDYVSAACLAMWREDFEHIGGFHYAYEPAYYEDTELCFSIKALGKAVVVDPRSRVIHFEHQTTKTYGANGALAGVVPANQKLFVRRRDSGLIEAEATLGFDERSFQHASCGVAGWAVLHSPYPLTPGGGEKYLLTIAKVLHDRGYRVTLALDEVYSKLRIAKIARELQLENPICDCMRIDEIDAKPEIFIAMGNHVVPDTPAIGKISIFHCQFPFPASKQQLLRSELLNDFDFVLVNSEFTANWFEATVKGEALDPRPIEILNPPVDLLPGSSQNQFRKRNSIVSIGRFFRNGHSKRHDVMIQAFKELSATLPGASLTLIGSSTHNPDDMSYLAELRQMSQGSNIEIIVDASREEINAVLAESEIYWHAAGMHVNHYRAPESLEHFGIAVVEAMSSGAIPLVFHKGGPASIVRNDIDGFTYGSADELILITHELCSMPAEKVSRLRQNAIERTRAFSVTEFKSRFEEIIEKSLSQSND